MRKIKILTLTLGMAAVITALAVPAFLTGNTHIIGGADLPTYEFHFLNSGNGLFLWLLNLGVPTTALAALWLFCPGWIRKLTNGKTSAVVLGISAAGGCGLAAVLWCVSMSLGGFRDYPVALPVSIAMGLGALGAFLILCLAYFGVRRKECGFRGILADVVTSILFLPGFACFAMWAAASLQDLL